MCVLTPQVRFYSSVKIFRMAAGFERRQPPTQSSEVKASPQASSLVKLLHGRPNVSTLPCSMSAYVAAAEGFNTRTRR